MVAKGYGGVGIKLDRSHNDSIEEVFKNARDEYAKGHSVLINCLIGKTNFRDGSISI